MSDLQRTLRRVGERRAELEAAESDIHDVDSAFRSANTAADAHDVDVSTTTGIKEVRITAHWYCDSDIPDRVEEQLHADVWDNATMYRGGGHAKSKPKEHEYHITAERTIHVSGRLDNA